MKHKKIIILILILILSLYVNSDNPPTQQFVSPTPANASTYYADGIYVNVSNSTGTNLPTDTFTVVDFDRDLQLWLRFDNVNGSGDAIDSSSFKNNASVQNTAFINGSGRWGNASNFDGNGGVVVLQNRTNGTNNLNFGADVGFTISFWVNGDQNATTRRIFQKVGSNGYNLLYSSTTLTRFRVTEGGVNINVNFVGNTMTRTWNNIVVGRNSTDAFFYFNGVANVTAADTTLSALDSLSGLEIGGDQLDTSLTLNGSIDEFMVWNRSLDYFEIRTLYNSSVNKYGHNFTNLSYENHTFRAYTVAANGTNASEERIVYLQAPASAPASFSGSEYNVTLNWSSYIGGSGQDSFREVIVLNDGNILSVGNFNLTNQTTILTNATFFGPTRNASVLVTKWRSNGSVIWQTLVGGSGTERGYGMDIDAEGNIYVAGQTNSSDFPTTAGVINETRLDGGGCLGSGHGCNLNAYVFKLNPHGNVLNYSTYIGGTGIDGARGGLAVSPDGFAYILGFTSSTDLPRAVNAYQGGFNDAFVTKINKNATRVEWSRYFGAPNDTSAQSEVTVGGKVDSQGDIYLHILVGDNGVNTTSTYAVNKSFYSGGNRDQFFVKLSSNGLTQYYATYSGGSGGDFGEHRIAIDKEGNAYFAAEVDSTDYPLTPNANQTTNHGVGDCVLVRLNSTGWPTYSTYFGGTANEVCTGPAVLFDGTMMTAGQTASTDLPVLRPLNSSSNGGTDLYVAVWNVTGSLMFSTYFGGTGSDQGRFMSINPFNGDILAITDSDSTDFPTTPGVYDTTFDGVEDGTLTVFSNKMFADREGTAPVVTFIYPGNGTTVSSVYNVFLNFSSNEVGSNVTLNDTRWIIDTVRQGQFFNFTNNSRITDGLIHIKVYANDSFGNNGSINVLFTQNATGVGSDTTPPVVTLLYPINRSRINEINRYSINLTSDEISNITFNDSRWSLDTAREGRYFNFTNNTPLTDGSYDIKVYANDSANNNGSININFIKDTTAPTITFTSPENRTTISRVDYFNINLTSNEVSNITLNDTRWTLSQVSNGVTFGFANNTAIGEGRQDIKVYANDSVANNGSINIQFFKDTVVPNTTIIFPLNGSTVTDTEHSNINMTSNEVVNITLNDTRWTLIQARESISFNFTNNTALTDGNYHLKAYVNDSGNNNGSINFNFLRDTTAPVITLVTPENRTTISRVDYFNINLTSNEVSNITLNDTRWTLSQVSNGVTFGFANNTVIGEGRQDIKVYANDSAGNNGSINIQFFKDTVVPIITLLNPTNRSTLLFIDYYNLNFSVNEVSNVTLNDTRFTLNVNTNGVSFNFTNNTLLANGGYDIKVYVNDSAGNNGSININFNKSTAPASSCGTLTSDTTLINDVTSAGTCFTIGASHITLDCNGFNITYATNNSNSQDGINIVSVGTGYNNITIRDCEINDISSTGSAQPGIRVDNSNNNSFINNTITTLSTTSRLIQFDNSSDNWVENNSLMSFGTSSFGILLSSRSNRNLIRYNNISTRGTNSYGVQLTTTLNDFNVIDGNKISTVDAVGILLDDANQTYLINNNISAIRQFEIQDLTPASEKNFLIYNDSFIDLRWHNNGSGNFYENITTNGTLGLGLSIFFANNTFAFNITEFQFPTRQRINFTANITFKGLSFGTINELRRTDNFTTDRDVIMGVGYNCSSAGGVLCNIQTYSGGILQFNSTGFSSFTANFSDGGIDTTSPSITAILPVAGTSFSPSSLIHISVNVTDSSGVSLVNASVNVPNGSVFVVTLLNDTTHRDQFNTSFSFTSTTGTYSVRFFANDTLNNIASSSTNFIISSPSEEGGAPPSFPGFEGTGGCPLGQQLINGTCKTITLPVALNNLQNLTKIIIETIPIDLTKVAEQTFLKSKDIYDTFKLGLHKFLSRVYSAYYSVKQSGLFSEDNKIIREFRGLLESFKRSGFFGKIGLQPTNENVIIFGSGLMVLILIPIIIFLVSNKKKEGGENHDER